MVIAGILTAAPAATAASIPFQGSDNVVAGSGARFSDGRYVVLLREPSAARYDGGNARFRATRPRGDTQFRADSAPVRAYTSHLRSTQRAIAGEVGARPVTSYTIAPNGFAARLTVSRGWRWPATGGCSGHRDTALRLDTWNTPKFLGLAGQNGDWASTAERAPAPAWSSASSTPASGRSRSRSRAALTATPDQWDIYRVGRHLHGEEGRHEFPGQCQPGEEWTAPTATGSSSAPATTRRPSESIPPEDGRTDEFISTRDGNGHGTHTASTAAGNRGVRARVEGRHFGKVSGMAPAAKLAAYKVCFSDNDPDSGDCYTCSTLDAVDDALADGVDVINYSISGAPARSSTRSSSPSRRRRRPSSSPPPPATRVPASRPSRTTARG